ncbi:MAG: thioesterase family protein, partial [Actinomycetota bacterium]|nr:thioesterase family protein [Actinomycetota bacterium]MDP2288214.1 thioesterase family protein [Actinomycetota bacterium]
MPDSLELLELTQVGEGRYLAPMPAGSQEGRDVIFGGQLLAQMIMAASIDPDDPKHVNSIHTIFARAGTYEQPLHLLVEDVHNGRTYGSKIVTAVQGERLLSKSMILMTADEPDFIAHQPTLPAGVLGPSALPESEPGVTFPGAALRYASAEHSVVNGVPAKSFWTRMPAPVGSLAASQAVIAWSTNGWLIGLALEAHSDVATLAQAHQSISTGVIGHTINFHREFDAGDWTLINQEASFAGKGRVAGHGTIFNENQQLLATFSQNSMVKGVDAAAVGIGTRTRM